MSYGASVMDLTRSYKSDDAKRRFIEQMLLADQRLKAEAQGANPANVSPESWREGIPYPVGANPPPPPSSAAPQPLPVTFSDTPPEDPGPKWYERGALRQALAPTREKLNQATEAAAYYVPPEMRGKLAAAPQIFAAMQPDFGLTDYQEAVEKFREGDYLRTGVNAVTGAASQVLDALPGGTLAKALPLAIFAGPAARHANLTKLNRYEELTREGVREPQIHRETGWFPGAEGKPRWEISDDRARFNHPGVTGQEVNLDQVLDHPEFFENYPQMRNVKVSITPNTGSRTKGSFTGNMKDPENDPPTIFLQDRDPKEMLSTLLHETQHGVQYLERTGRGSGGTFLLQGTPEWKIYQDRLKEVRRVVPFDEYRDVAGWGDDIEGAKQAYAEYVKGQKKITRSPLWPQIDRAAQETAIQEGYRRASGEVESRNVQRRQELTPEQRQISYPVITEDIPRSQQLVRLKGAYEQSAKGDPNDPYWHDITGLRLERPLSEVNVERTPSTLPPKQMIPDSDLEDALLGRQLVFTQSDRTPAGFDVSNIGGSRLDRPVTAVGGMDYARDPAHPYVWGSAPQVINKLAETGEKFKDRNPILMPFTMAHGGSNFSNMTAEALAAQGDRLRQISPEDAAAFTVMIREGYGSKTDKKTGKVKKAWEGDPKFPGLGDPEELRAYLIGPKRGPLRKAFVESMENKALREKGFPSVPEARYAFTADELLDAPTGNVGYMLGNLGGQREVTHAPEVRHPAYPSSILPRGNQEAYFGSIPFVPMEIAARDFQATRRAEGSLESKDYRAWQTKPEITQYVDRDLLEAFRRYWGRK
jgi:hypothetical protein